jgi:GAF domain-containing protein
MTPQLNQLADSETLTFELDLPEPPAARLVADVPHRADILRHAEQALASVADADELLRVVFEETKEVLGIDAYFNFMINRQGDALTLASYEGIAYQDARQFERLEFGRGICGNVALKRAPIVVTDVQTSDDPRVQIVKGFGIRSYACNPLFSGEHLLGTLSFASRTRNRFSEEDLDLFREISRYVALAYVRLRRVGQRRESDRRTHEFLVSLARELRDPLAPIRAALEVVRRKGLADPDLQAACVTIEQQLQSQVEQLNGLLDIPPVPEAQPATVDDGVTFTYVPIV